MGWAILWGAIGVLFLLAAYQWFSIDQVKFEGSIDRDAVTNHTISRSIGWLFIGIALGLIS
jgi:hypothetical protein